MNGAISEQDREEGLESTEAGGLVRGYRRGQCALTGHFPANMVTSCKSEKKKKIRPFLLKTLYGHLLEILINNDKFRVNTEVSIAHILGLHRHAP